MTTTPKPAASPFIALAVIGALGLVLGAVAFLVGITSWDEYAMEFGKGWALTAALWLFPIGVLATLIALGVAAMLEGLRFDAQARVAPATEPAPRG
jgi:hypothetical protein